MPAKKVPTQIYELYRFGLYLKGILGFFELSVGLFLYFNTKAELHQLLLIIAQEELIEDPNDPFIAFLQNLLIHFTDNIQSIAVTFLILHGVAKCLLIYGLVRNYLWVYPIAVIVFLLFILQQGYYLTHTFSQGVAWIMLLNTIVLGLIGYEWWYIKKHHKHF
ncbi:DUF2127 domain-containing protein [Candidatus Peregrinibacteria bacterium]|nr:MAG: DUF2127 domain-containing protein [Candidatus Peregrinibacteria bacterium]